jgi:hypothetical protein
MKRVTGCALDGIVWQLADGGGGVGYQAPLAVPLNTGQHTEVKCHPNQELKLQFQIPQVV